MTLPELLQLVLLLVGGVVDRLVDWLTGKALARAHQLKRAPLTAAAGTATWHVARDTWDHGEPWHSPTKVPQPTAPVNWVQLMARGLEP